MPAEVEDAALSPTHAEQTLPKISRSNGNDNSIAAPHSPQSSKGSEPDVEEHVSGASGDGVRSEQPKLSKNQQKKLKRKQEWEDGREARKVRRKEKNKERKIRKRAAAVEIARTGDEDQTPRAEQHHISDSFPTDEDCSTNPINASAPIGTEAYNSDPTPSHSKEKEERKRYRALQLPLTFIYDCDFDDLMNDSERISLASQLTRAYSDNRKARYRAHMVVSSFGGKLKERFEGILGRHHEQWKGVTFTDGDFVQASGLAKGAMQAPAPSSSANCNDETLRPAEIFREGALEQPEVVYLTSDSPHSLEYLRPYSTYIIGGIVDKNRHKGICYKRACDRGIKTAKLPIGEYMRMSSRQVLATNHVGEIMLKWLSCDGDWGKAFDSAIPKRKGGVLKDRTGEGDGNKADHEDEVDGEVNRDVSSGRNEAGDEKEPSDGGAIHDHETKD